MIDRNTKLDFLLSMRHSTVENYVVPGLTSSLIGNPSASGTVRLFECSRNHQEVITPHSHRFDFECHVLEGTVTNRVWTPDSRGDEHQTIRLDYKGKIGEHKKYPQDIRRWSYGTNFYQKGDSYSMTCDEVHSIWFSRDTKVLFLEGATKREFSIALEPVVNGVLIETMQVQPWMFRKVAT
jgi:hypothetical protein